MRILNVLFMLTAAFIGGYSPCSAANEPARSDFTDTQRYSTEGNPKARGVKMVMRFPSSWRALNTEYPNIVQYLISDEGIGLEAVQIEVQPLQVSGEITRKAAKYVLRTIEASKLIPSQATLISRDEAEIDGEPAAVLEYTLARKKGDYDVRNHLRTVVFIQGKALMFVIFSASNMNGDAAEAAALFERHRPLFKYMMGTITLTK